jgi:hypothetical protein
MASMAVNLPACSFGWWLMANADLFWEKSTAGWLLVTGLFWEKSTAGWWLISQANGAFVTRSLVFCYINIGSTISHDKCHVKKAKGSKGCRTVCNGSWPKRYTRKEFSYICLFDYSVPCAATSELF